MHYFKIRPEFDPAVTGIGNASGAAKFIREFRKLNPLIGEYIWGNGRKDYLAGKFPEFDLNLTTGITLEWSAKKTDFLSFEEITFSFLVSPRLREILESSFLPPHKFYEVNMVRRNKRTKAEEIISDYRWFYYNRETGEHTVNFERSEFELHQYVWEEHQRQFPSRDVKFNNYGDYMNHINVINYAPEARKLVFNKNFNPELDFWGARNLFRGTYISERLLEKFQRNNITGYMILKGECEMVFE